jgi:predicted transcriptional regulator
LARTRTIRIDDDLDDAIQKLAEKERSSANAVVNKALQRFVDWDRASFTRGMVSVPSKLMNRLMSSQTPEEARKLGRWAGTQLFIPNMKAQYATVTTEVAINGMSMLSSYGGRFEFAHKLTGRAHVILIRHSLGPNWSSYYAGSLESIFGEFLKKKLKLRVTADLCICQFED